MTKNGTIIALFLIAILFVAGVYSVTSNIAEEAHDQGSITALAARKEDLLTTQQRIEDQLALLNASLEAAVAQQQELAQEVQRIESTSGVTSGSSLQLASTKLPKINIPTIPTTRTTTTRTTTTQPAPTPAPRPVPVTRAS